MLAGVLNEDPLARLILLNDGQGPLDTFMASRLAGAGVDLERVTFSGALPHHQLMALYRLSDVVLDSYYAGGCTTTREALEVGGVVVTLPGTLAALPTALSVCLCLCNCMCVFCVPVPVCAVCVLCVVTL